jgi:Rps23 Pro-64 3,4-dihydroxylase Tpa1-like proline 4-hydroxylase
MLNPIVADNAGELAIRFQNARPFRHIVIADFLKTNDCEELLRQFPPFERGNARNEAGELGAKSTVEKIRELGPLYAALDDLIQTREFLDLIGRITGIPDLLYDPWYFGGGTHENREGQDLDAHVDFNRHPVERWHRRLNLIVYLNHEWESSWGGSLELHSDPRAADDIVELVVPLFNRAVIFETTEWSWHGFSRITLPDQKKNLSRKSIALYFYTTDRPSDELADTHSTIYVDRPLPDYFRAGTTLDEGHVQELRALLARRDQHNQRLYREITSLTGRLEQITIALNRGFLGRLRYFVRRLLGR